MTYAPTRIYGPIIPNSNSFVNNLPGITQYIGAGGVGDVVISSSGAAKELYTRTLSSENLSGLQTMFHTFI